MLGDRQRGEEDWGGSNSPQITPFSPSMHFSCITGVIYSTRSNRQVDLNRSSRLFSAQCSDPLRGKTFAVDRSHPWGVVALVVERNNLLVADHPLRLVKGLLIFSIVAT